MQANLPYLINTKFHFPLNQYRTIILRRFNNDIVLYLVNLCDDGLKRIHKSIALLDSEISSISQIVLQLILSLTKLNNVWAEIRYFAE